MKKYLLFGTALFIAAGSFSQNSRFKKPTGIAETPFIINEPVEPTTPSSSVLTGPVKKARPAIKSNAKIAVVTATNFTGSMNYLSYLLSSQKILHYTKDINAVSFVARKSTTYSASSNSNSGTIVGLWSTNLGTTWNETCIWANANDLARYPQGGIWNPAGNTNINNAYIVGMGPFTSAAGGWGGPTNGHWYASKQITAVGNTTPGPDQQSAYYQGGFLKSKFMNRQGFEAIDGGLVRSLGNIVNDPAGTTNLAYGLRGHLMVKGQFNAGAFVWSVDSFMPPVNTRSDGSLIVGTNYPMEAWSENGAVGYVITLGSRTGTGPTTNGIQPIVWITTNFGATWGILPAQDFADPINFKGVWDRTYPVNTNTNIVCANFQGSEGMAATVDVNGQLHLASMTYGHYSNHQDSLGYRYTFGTEVYSYDESGPFGYPVIYDFYTKPSGGWDYHMVDSMGTEGPGGASGDPGYSSNPWTTASAKIAYDARIQVGRSADGQKVYYSWSESDSTVVGLKWNAYPDIKLKAFDVVANKVTPRMNVTTGVTGADQQAYFHFMSDKAAGASSSCLEVPFSIEYNGTNNGDVQMDAYYLSGAQLCPASFSLNPMSPKGVGVGVTNANTVNYDVLNFPNPADKATTIVVGLKEASNFEVVIYNSIGQVVDTYKLNGQIGSNEINVDLSNFRSGVYFYNVKVGGSIVTKKLVVQ